MGAPPDRSRRYLISFTLDFEEEIGDDETVVEAWLRRIEVDEAKGKQNWTASFVANLVAKGQRRTKTGPTREDAYIFVL